MGSVGEHRGGLTRLDFQTNLTRQLGAKRFSHVIENFCESNRIERFAHLATEYEQVADRARRVTRGFEQLTADLMNPARVRRCAQRGAQQAGR
jgi:hypothetical protein